MTGGAPPRRASRLAELLSSEFTARLDAMDVTSRKILQGKLHGERRSKRRGQSVEFADHRPYAHGDDLRFLDWNIYGRLDQLFLKLFLEEQDLSLHVLVDVSGSTATGDPPKDVALKRLAAALVYVGLVNNNRVSLCMFADGVVRRLAHMRGRRYLPALADALLDSGADGPTGFEKSCRQWAAARVGSGVTVVLSDFLFKEGCEAGLKRLLDPRFELCIIQMLSPQERKPQLTGDLTLVDIEDGDTADISATPALLDRYARNLAAWCTGLKEFCARRGAVYVLTDSSQSVERLVLHELRTSRILG